MPWYGFIHPVFAVLTLVYGIVTARISLGSPEDWNFPLRRVRTRSVVYFLFCVANLVMGLMISSALRGRGVDVDLTFHVPLAVAALVLALLASLATFTRSRKPGELSSFMRFHGWIIAVSLAAILTMGFIGLLALFGI